MAIVVDRVDVGHAFVDASATTIAFNTSFTVAANAFIVVGVSWFSGSAFLSSVAGGGLTWAVDVTSNSGVLTPRTGVASAQAPSGLASGTTITATLNATAPARFIGGISFTGVKTSSPLDGTPGKAEASTAGWSSGSQTLTAGSVLVAFNFNEGTITGNTTTSPSIEAWEQIDGTGGDGQVAEYRIESSAGSYAVAGTWDAAHNNGTGFAAYLAAPSAVITDVSLDTLPGAARISYVG